MSRILEVSGAAGGGVRAHLHDCALLLADGEHTVVVAAPPSVIADLEDAHRGVRTHPVPIGSRPSHRDLGVVRTLGRLAREADVIHAHGLRAGALAALALGPRRGAGAREPGGSRPRLVVNEHNLPVGSAPVRALGALLERLVAHRADLVLGVSPDLVASARADGARRVELAVVPAPQAFQGPGPEEVEALRREVARLGDDVSQAPDVRTLSPVEVLDVGVPGTGLDGPTDVAPDHGPPPGPDVAADDGPGRAGLTHGRVLVLTVARLAPQKGLDLLLDTAALLTTQVTAGRLTPFTWLVAGEGPGRAAAEQRIAADHLPVHLLGRRGDVPALMAACDVVVQTSLWEGQPLTVQEALRAGAALIATDVGGTAVTARGGAALVEPEARALADAVGAMVADPHRRRRARQATQAAARALPTRADLADQLTEALNLPR